MIVAIEFNEKPATKFHNPEYGLFPTLTAYYT